MKPSIQMCFNASKSSVVRIGGLYKHSCDKLKISKDYGDFTSQVKYLGVHIATGSQFKIDINKQKANFYTAVNGLLARCKSGVDEFVKIHLRDRRTAAEDKKDGAGS
jgi:hypothetical protein